MKWLLPEFIADTLPEEALLIERLRRVALDHFRLRGYEFVIPPLMEYLHSLLTGIGSDLELKTFKLVDQLSGQTMGVRADMTPQVARIDAHLLNRTGVTRLCYCGSVLHALPESEVASREPIQLGAELYGYAGIDADIEVIRLLASVLSALGISASRIDVGHVGVFRALASRARITQAEELKILALLQEKDVSGLRECCASIEEPYRSALIALPTLFGDDRLLKHAANVLPDLPEISAALETLTRLQAALPELPLSFDLADLPGYHYHNGMVFSAYHHTFPAAFARGGRYDGVGKAFGRARPATGFSTDIRVLARLLAQPSPTGAIVAPPERSSALNAKILELRQQGEVVLERLPQEVENQGIYCDRRLVCRDGVWNIQSIDEV